jgi:hypothetical protein
MAYFPSVLVEKETRANRHLAAGTHGSQGRDPVGKQCYEELAEGAQKGALRVVWYGLQH